MRYLSAVPIILFYIGFIIACSKEVNSETDAEWILPLASLNHKYNLFDASMDMEAMSICIKDLADVRSKIQWLLENKEPWSSQYTLASAASKDLDVVDDVLSFFKSSRKHKVIK